jgi:hypothetical protein
MSTASIRLPVSANTALATKNNKPKNIKHIVEMIGRV